MKKVISIVLVLCMVMVLAAGCSSNEKKIVGTWQSTQTTSFMGLSLENKYIFNEDGTGSMPILESGISISFTYMIDGDTLTLITDTPILQKTYVYTMEFEDDTLILGDDSGENILVKMQ